MNINTCTLVGIVSRSPESKRLPSGTTVAEFVVSITRSWYDRQTKQRRTETDDVPITCFGNVADIAAEQLSRGAVIAIEGRLQCDRWEDKQTGQPRSKLKLIASNVQTVRPRQPPREAEPAAVTDDSDVPF